MASASSRVILPWNQLNVKRETYFCWVNAVLKRNHLFRKKAKSASDVRAQMKTHPAREANQLRMNDPERGRWAVIRDDPERGTEIGMSWVSPRPAWWDYQNARPHQWSADCFCTWYDNAPLCCPCCKRRACSPRDSCCSPEPGIIPPPEDAEFVPLESDPSSHGTS